MASATRLAWVLAGTTSWGHTALCADGAVPASYSASGYSLSYDKDQWSEEYSVFNVAVADRLGVLGSGFAASDDPRLRPLTRLDSGWNFTAPLLTMPARIGDGVSSTGFWDQPARFGGLQLGSFQPALPAVVAPPSTIAIPFESVGPVATTSSRFIDHLRSLVQLQTQSLEIEGQGDFSVESGRLRENFEARSADYGAWLTSGTYRYGFNATTTLDGQVAQVAGQQNFVGLGVLERVGPLGLVSARIAGSRDLDTSGWVARMGYDYTCDWLSVALRSHRQSAGYQDVGDAAAIEPLRQRTLASARIDLGALGRVSLASATQTYTDDSRRDIVALSHAMPFGGGGVLSTAAAYSPGQLGNTALLMSFTYPFDYVGTRTAQRDAMDSALDRTIVDAFGQSQLGAATHPFLGRWATE